MEIVFLYTLIDCFKHNNTQKDFCGPGNRAKRKGPAGTSVRAGPVWCIALSDGIAGLIGRFHTAPDSRDMETSVLSDCQSDFAVFTPGRLAEVPKTAPVASAASFS